MSDDEMGHRTHEFFLKFWISLILTIPVILYSKFSEELFELQVPTFLGSHYVPFLLGTIVFFYGGGIFLKGAWHELKAKRPGMMTLIALAVLLVYLYNVSIAILGEGEPLFWELTTLITVILLGHWMKMRAANKTNEYKTHAT